MHYPLKNLKRASDMICLSTEEKEYMRAQIFERINASERAQAAARPRRSSYSFIFSMRYAVSLALVLVILAGGSTAYAAQGALPGETLYPVKVYVNENVQGALAVSDQAKLSYHTQIAEVRLAEAETLASQGKLDATTTQEIEQNLDTHVAQADAIVNQLQNNDPGDAADASVVLDSSLAAHGAILDHLGNGSQDNSTKENAHQIAERILTRDDTTEGSGDTGSDAVVAVAATPTAPPMHAMAFSTSVASTSGSEGSTSSDTVVSLRAKSTTGSSSTSSVSSKTASTTARKIALQFQKRAAEQLSDAQSSYDDAKDSLAATTSDKVESELTDLTTRMDAGGQNITDGNYDAARATFTGVIQDSVELSALIDASKQFDQDFIRSSWRGGDGSNDGLVEGAATSSSSVSSSTPPQKFNNGRGRGHGGNQD